jgi:hypothetical protein
MGLVAPRSRVAAIPRVLADAPSRSRARIATLSASLGTADSEGRSEDLQRRRALADLTRTGNEDHLVPIAPNLLGEVGKHDTHRESVLSFSPIVKNMALAGQAARVR